ncbi:hypothetical protein H2509_06130 [Stappia sp. F7233]|uniref:Peptidase M4 family protein n=1 Tax=Stappia albiluteola TaxID=2758565 RepID=A0A839AAV3_9HYPH|nr:hypothetical protein [Stappia albiluteola]
MLSAPPTSNPASLGTRFLIYPQAPHVPGYGTPETVWISTDPASLQPGPADRRIYVRDPALQKDPYEFPYLPPFTGETFEPATAGPDGHFDTIPTSSRAFVSAHAFACVSRVLDIWESYLGRPIDWHFAETYERLEIIPWLDWENAQSGYGFLELGIERDASGEPFPFALNFDTIAHEVGHSILFSLMGVPEDGRYTPDFGAFHEASADLVSLISFLHFDSGLDRLLRGSQGNLLTLNELNRIAELAGERQIRLASNSRRMSEVTGEIHDRSRPFTGAIFDTIADTFHGLLVADGLVDERLLDLDIREFDEALLEHINAFTADAYRARPFLFKAALTEARDFVGISLARAWDRLLPDGLNVEDAGLAVIEAADELRPGLARQFEINFRWREIV